MKLLKNRAAAIIVLIAAIALSSLYGLSKRPAVAIPEGGAALNTNLSTAYVDKYIVDEARTLSGSARNTINLYTANWDQLTGSILAVVSVRWGRTTQSCCWTPAPRITASSPAAGSMTGSPPSPPALWTPAWWSTSKRGTTAAVW